MAINTGGFGVQVMPQYTPVDPSLAAFNPIAVTHGLLDAYQLAGNAEQLKAFKQHAAEIASTEAIRTKLLQAQADQEAIKRDHELAIKQSKIDSDLAHNDYLAKLFPQKATTEVGGLKNESALQSGALQLGLGQQGIDLSKQLGIAQAQPFLNQSQLNAAKSGVISSAGELDRAPTQQDLATINQGVEALKAQYAPALATMQGQKALKDLGEELSNNPDSVGEMNKALTRAKIKLDEAQAKNYETANNTKLQIAQQRYSTHNTLSQDYARQAQVVARLESEKMPNPESPDDTTYTAGKLASFLSADPKKLHFWESAPEVTPYQKQVVEDILRGRDRLRTLDRALSTIADQLSGDTTSQESAQSVPVYGIDPKTGKYGLIK